MFDYQNLLTIIGQYAHYEILILPDGQFKITELPMSRYTIYFKKKNRMKSTTLNRANVHKNR